MQMTECCLILRRTVVPYMLLDVLVLCLFPRYALRKVFPFFPCSRMREERRPGISDIKSDTHKGWGSGFRNFRRLEKEIKYRTQ